MTRPDNPQGRLRSRPVRIAVILVLVVLAALGMSVAVDVVTAKAAHAYCVEDDGSRCDTPREYARGFRQGELRNSRGTEFNARIKRKIRAWYRNHPDAASTSGSGEAVNTTQAGAAGDGPWWDDVFQASICVMWGGQRSSCLTRHTRDSVRKFTIIKRQTTRVTLKCGGAAIMGAMGGRLDSGKVGWWGAGLGGGACLYQHIGTKMSWW